MDLLLDPTFVLTRRGQQWIHRAWSAPTPLALLVPATLLESSRAPFRETLDIYASPFGASWWYDRSPLDLPHSVAAVRSEPIDELAASLLAGGAWTVVVAELWNGLARGACLVARRPPTFDLLVQMGVRLVTERSCRDASRLDELEARMGSDLMDALRRRVRYFALVDSTDSPTLHVFDAGRYGYR